MEWKPGGISDDVEDRRDDGGGGGGFGGYGPHLGIGGTIVLLVLSLLFHRNLFTAVLRRRLHGRPAGVFRAG